MHLARFLSYLQFHAFRSYTISPRTMSVANCVCADKKYELGKVLSHDIHSHTFVGSVIGQADEGKSFRVRQIFNAAADRVRADHSSAIVSKLKGLSHPNLLPIVDSYLLSNENTGSRDLCIVSEDFSGSTLAQKLGENSFEPEVTCGMPALELSGVMDVFFGVLEALSYLHSQGTHHMDLTPENVLFPEKGGVVLTSYGLRDIVAVDSLEFVSPEVHRREALSPDMMRSGDIWAFGALMLYVASGKLIVTRLSEACTRDLTLLLTAYDARTDHSPEEEGEQWSLLRVIEDYLKEYPRAEPLWTRLPPPLIALLRWCLTVNPTHRPSVPQLLASPEYCSLLAARKESTTVTNDNATVSADGECEQSPQAELGCEEREELQRQIAELTERAAVREERMEFLETVLAEERAGHFRTADLLSDMKDELEEALERISQLEKEAEEREEGDGKAAQESPVPVVLGQHHPGFYNGEQNEWNCCNKKGRLPPGCQEGIVMHHDGYYDPYGGGIWGCCRGGWNSPGCRPGEQPRWER